MMDEFYRREKTDYTYSEVWVYVDGWQSNTTADLIVADLGLDVFPKSRTTAEEISGRDGFVLQQRPSYEPYEREIVFVARTKKALHKLYGKLKQGQVYDFVVSTDPAYIRTGFVREIELEKLNANATKATYQLVMQPYKTARHTATYNLDSRQPVDNIGDADGLPKLYVEGTGEVTVTAAGQTLTLDLGTGSSLVVDCGAQEVYDAKTNSLANSKLKRGYFWAIPVGKTYITVSGNARGKIEVNWRYTP